jgi:dienelactone hydrolase
MKRSMALALALTWSFGLGISSAQAARIDSLETPVIKGLAQRYLWSRDDAAPVREVVVLLAGGDGYVRFGLIDAAPTIGSRGFIVAARGLLMRPGTALALPDAPAPGRSLAVEDRQSPAHAAFLAALLDDITARAPGAKPYLLGYSNGAVSAAVAARGSERPAGVIMLSGVFRSMSDFAEFNVKAPVLVIHHERDACVRPEFDERFRSALKPAMVRDIALNYGPEPCGLDSAHQFYGQERIVAETVLRWIDSGIAPSRIR